MAATFKQASLIIFCTLLPLFLFLLSYKAVLFLTPLSLEQQEVLRGDFSRYSPEEQSHLRDVSRLMQAADYLFYALLLLLSLLFTYHKNDTALVAGMLRYGGIATLAVVGLFLLAVLAGFDSTFTLFHRIFFPQGNWQFPAGSALLATFPEFFFRRMGLMIGLGTAVLGALAAVFPNTKKILQPLTSRR